jgi:hypothetical protein
MQAGPPSWIRWFILIGAGFFIFALFLSAVFDPKIRVLHALQALIYVSVIFLTRRNNAWGFGAGFTIAMLWNYINLFITNFIHAGWDRFLALIHTGHLQRTDLLVALVAGGGHFLLIIACLTGFLRTRPRSRAWTEFIAGGALSVAYFVVIIFTTGPQYIPLLKRTFRL